MKRFLCGAAALCLFFTLAAQPPPSIQELQIGDPVPDVTINNLINSTTTSARFSDYKGKLLILDFWATWCTPCVASFPKTDSLRNAFAGRADILPVTYQSKAEVEKLFQKSTHLKGIRLPIATDDTTLRFLFPHNGLPHYVWISPEGKVLAITGIEQVNRATIEKMLAGSTPALAEKKDPLILPYDRELPLLFNEVTIAPEDLDFEVIHMGYKQGFSSRYDVLRYADQSIARISMTNLCLRDMFMLAFSSNQLAYSRNRVIMETRDSVKLLPMEFKGKTEQEIINYQTTNLHCFELIVPRRLSENTMGIMREELARLFPQYSVRAEKRVAKCLALERTSAIDKVKSKGGKPGNHFDTDGFTVNVGTFPFVLAHFNNLTLQHLKIPIVDNTGYSGKIDLQLNGSMSDLDNLRRELKKYDLALIEKRMPIDMLVFADRQ